MTSPVWSELHHIRNTNPRPLRVPQRDKPRGAFLTGEYLIDMSIIYPGLHKTVKEELARDEEQKDEDERSQESEKEKEKEIFRAVAQRARHLVDRCVGTSVTVDRAVGSLIGLVLGDALGAPLEFIPAGNSSSTSGVRLQPDKEMMDKAPLVYTDQFNKFRLLRGQWTDDASMSFCLADSMIERSGPGSETGDAYDGADCRCRYLMWWSYGYNNAFKFDHERRTGYSAHSVGLGGNIANSLEEVFKFGGQMASTAVPPRFTARGEDAGNGSIMRLAPIPIRYHSDVRKAMLYAAEQSYSTHPGGDAAVCCMFMTYFQIRAIHRSEEAPGSVRDFLTEEIIPSFLQEIDMISQKGGPEENEAVDSTAATTVDGQLKAVVRASAGGLGRLTALLRCQPPSPKEACWEWNTEDDYCRVIGQTLRARGRVWNGYPVDPGYFGSYCMDGLAMGLWALTHSTSLMDCLVKTANLLGDADTTCAIAGQLAGSFYGYQSFFSPSVTETDENDGEHVSNPTLTETTAAGKIVLEKWLRRWDPHSEIELRALLLYSDGAGFINETTETSTKRQR